MANDYVSGEGLTPTAENPFVRDLVEGGAIGEKLKVLRGKRGWITRSHSLVDPQTGEVIEDSLCLATKIPVDRGQFVKVFVDGLRATFDLNKPARDAFAMVLESVNDDQAGKGRRNDMIIFSYEMAVERGWSTLPRQFRSAMNQLCHNKFLCPVAGTRDWYWTNPAFFHKGDRLVVVQHYVLDDGKTVQAGGDPDLDQLDFDGMTKRERVDK